MLRNNQRGQRAAHYTCANGSFSAHDAKRPLPQSDWAPAVALPPLQPACRPRYGRRAQHFTEACPAAQHVQRSYCNSAARSGLHVVHDKVYRAALCQQRLLLQRGCHRCLHVVHDKVGGRGGAVARARPYTSSRDQHGYPGCAGRACARDVACRVVAHCAHARCTGAMRHMTQSTSATCAY